MASGPAFVDMGDEREDERIDEWLWLTVAGLYYTDCTILSGMGWRVRENESDGTAVLRRNRGCNSIGQSLALR